MQVAADFWLETDIGELDVEIKADVSEGDYDGPSIFHGTWVEIYQVVLKIGNQRIDITDEVFAAQKYKDICTDRILETYDEAKQEAKLHRARAYRHVDLHV